MAGSGRGGIGGEGGGGGHGAGRGWGGGRLSHPFPSLPTPPAASRAVPGETPGSAPPPRPERSARPLAGSGDAAPPPPQRAACRPQPPPSAHLPEVPRSPAGSGRGAPGTAVAGRAWEPQCPGGAERWGAARLRRARHGPVREAGAAGSGAERPALSAVLMPAEAGGGSGRAGTGLRVCVCLRGVPCGSVCACVGSLRSFPGPSSR